VSEKSGRPEAAALNEFRRLGFVAVAVSVAVPVAVAVSVTVSVVVVTNRASRGLWLRYIHVGPFKQDIHHRRDPDDQVPPGLLQVAPDLQDYQGPS